MTKNVPQEDLQIISWLRSGIEKEREMAFRSLYRKMYNKAVGWIVNQKGSETQGRTAFNIALMRLEQKVIPQDFELSSSLSSFLMGILRLVWLEERRKISKYETIDPATERQLTSDSIEENDDIQEQLLKCIHSLSQDCKRILYFKYWLNLNMKQIADNMGFVGKNAAFSAANKKNKCLKKLVLECDHSQFVN